MINERKQINQKKDTEIDKDGESKTFEVQRIYLVKPHWRW